MMEWFAKYIEQEIGVLFDYEEQHIWYVTILFVTPIFNWLGKMPRACYQSSYPSGDQISLKIEIL